MSKQTKLAWLALTAVLGKRSDPADTVTVGAGQTLKVIAGAIDLSDNVQFASDVKTSTETVEGVTTYTARDWMPKLPEEPTASDVEEAIETADFADDAVAGVINGAADPVAEYGSFKTWAEGIGISDVVSSGHAADSYLLGMETLLVNDPEVTIDTFETDDSTGLISISVSVKDGGEPVDVSLAKVKELVKASEDVNDWTSEANKLDPELEVSGDKITVSLSSEEPVMFLKIKKQ